MKKILPLATVLFILISMSCSRKPYYTSNNFDQLTAKHRRIAILPAEVVLTGKKPEKMSDSAVAALEASESRSFQVSLYNNILQYANQGKYHMRVEVQAISKTQSELDKHGISYKDIYTMDDTTLCRLLGVDAVVRMQIQKTRYMNDMVSYGSQVFNDVVFRNIGGIIPGTGTPLPSAPTKTNDIYARCTVQNDGIVLWNDRYTGSADWSRPANQIIAQITVKFAQHFPYREKG